MARKVPPAGKITTFFSFKGGVGRTMAVANVGFIAAMAGKRVLLIDCDLEAPGLPVYFRGVTEHEAAGVLRKAPGMLDLFAEWRDTLIDASGSEQVSSVFNRFKSGEPFEDCACPLLPPAWLPNGGKFDIIGAGSAKIGAEKLPYAEALSHFQWPEFFDGLAGGAMLEALRNWARRSYDVILIDSRTGFADVAGICTMQLPDEVLLCFVLNRQNTEGIADIAASIIAARGGEVSIRLAPMRVSKDRPAEEADARARAHRELRKAGIDPQRIDEDMAKLSIAAASNIPFYETLAPFVATSTTADPLTFEYLRMTQILIGAAIEAPRIEPAWLEAVRRRLLPRMATVEYLDTLKNADPDRAGDEVDRFLDGALDADPSRDLDTDYVEALVAIAFEASDWLSGDDEKEFPRPDLAEKALRLLRQLHDMGDGDWRIPLVDALDEFDMRWSGMNADAVIEGNREREIILAAGSQTVAILVRRADLHTETARLYFSSQFLEQFFAELEAAENLLHLIAHTVPPKEAEDVAFAHAKIAETRAEVFTRGPKLGDAAEQWRRVIALLTEFQTPRSHRLLADAHLGLADLDEKSAESLQHVLTAAQLRPASVLRDIKQFTRACNIVLRAKDAGIQSAAFTQTVFARPKSTPNFIPYTGFRSTNDAAIFASQLERLAIAISSTISRRSEILSTLAAVAEWQINRSSRIGRLPPEKRAIDNSSKMIQAFTSLHDTLVSAAAPAAATASLQQRIDKLRRGADRPAP